MDEEYQKPRREPETIKEFRDWICKVTGRTPKVIAILTAHWPHNERSWYRDLWSLVKYERDFKKHAVIINSFIKNAKTKEIKETQDN